MPSDRFDHIFIQPASFDASLAFYRDALGWTVKYAWGNESTPRGACLSSGAMTVVIAEDHPAEDNSKTDGINGTRPTVHVQVEDLDARFNEVAASGLQPTPIQTTHWGTRWFIASDPDGNLIAFEQPTAA